MKRSFFWNLKYWQKWQPDIFFFFFSYICSRHLHRDNNFISGLLMSYNYINTSYLEMVTGGDREITDELITIFRQQVDEFYLQMLTANKPSDYNVLSQIAHKAKSSVAIMGMDDMAAMLKTLEVNARDSKETDSFIEIIEAFRSQTNEAIVELNHYLQSL
jgi:hypothetical protein